MFKILFPAYLILTVSAAFLFRIGALTKNPSFVFKILGITFNQYTIIGILCYGCSFVMWMYLLQKNELSWLVPLALGISNIMTMIGSVVILKETVGFIQLGGFIFILIGTILLNIK